MKFTSMHMKLVDVVCQGISRLLCSTCLVGSMLGSAWLCKNHIQAPFAHHACTAGCHGCGVFQPCGCASVCESMIERTGATRAFFCCWETAPLVKLRSTQLDRVLHFTESHPECSSGTHAVSIEMGTAPTLDTMTRAMIQADLLI